MLPDMERWDAASIRTAARAESRIPSPGLMHRGGGGGGLRRPAGVPPLNLGEMKHGGPSHGDDRPGKRQTASVPRSTPTPPFPDSSPVADAPRNHYDVMRQTQTILSQAHRPGASTGASPRTQYPRGRTPGADSARMRHGLSDASHGMETVHIRGASRSFHHRLTRLDV